jgi:uncharacterized protein (TIGR02996 family)
VTEAGERDALLAAVFAAPAEDTPRLVYADWLDEHGEETYAEFIRVQIALARDGERSPERARLKQRESAVWKRLKRRWADLFAAILPEKRCFTRGFHDGTAEGRMQVSADTFVAHSAAWWPRLPFRQLTVTAVTQFPDEVLDCDYLRRLGWLDLFVSGVGEFILREEFVVRLFSCDRFDRLVSLTVNHLPLTRRIVDAIRACPFLPQLRKLWVGYWCAGHRGRLTFPGPDRYIAPEPGGAPEAIGRQLDGLTDQLVVVPQWDTGWPAVQAATAEARAGGT